MTRTDWLQFLSHYTGVGVLFLVFGLVVVVVTLFVERRRARRRKDRQWPPQMMQRREVRFWAKR